MPLIHSNKVGTNFLSKISFYDYLSYVRVQYKRSDFCEAYNKTEPSPVPLPSHPGHPAPKKLLSTLLAISQDYLYISKQNAYMAIF